MQLLNIYFPHRWWDLLILVSIMVGLSLLIKLILWSGKSKKNISFWMPFQIISILVIIWFLVAKTVPWIKGLLNKINLSTIPWWVWIIALALIILFFFRRRVFYKKTPAVAGATTTTVKVRRSFSFWNTFLWLLTIAFIWFFVVPRVRPYFTANRDYPRVLINQDNDFKAGEKKSFEVKNFGDPLYPYPVNTNDTITFTCDGPSGHWIYKTWTSKGRVGYEQIEGQQSLVEGIHTIETDRPCTLFISTTKPALLLKK